MASSITAFATIFFASYALALPQPIAARDTASIGCSWYQGSLTFSGMASVDPLTGSCGSVKVSTGELSLSECQVLRTMAIGIAPSTSDCVFKMWDGVQDCSGDGEWTSYAIPSGDNMTCLETGVYDGGNFLHRSGILTCS